MIKENNKVINKALTTVSPEDRFQSVTLDFLRSLPELDVDNNKNHLMAGLYAVGFDVEKKIDRVDNVNIRYRHSPIHVRETTIFQGQLRNEYPYKSIYKNHDVLDVDARNHKNSREFGIIVEMLQSESKKIVTDLPYDVPDYLGVEVGEKNFNRSPEEKKRYLVINPRELGLSELLEQVSLFESPFEEGQKENE
ncbi:hypothetical protein BNCALIDO_00133 [Aeromonas phage vB_AdhM_TS9]|nr:hypothetical protein BNCALIDO_00133 [Aeromonas phage vB_AdhM_TS9]